MYDTPLIGVLLTDYLHRGIGND